MNPKRPDNNQQSLLKLALYLSGIGMMFAVCIVAGYLIGAWMEHRFEAAPLWKGLGAIIGMVVGIINTFLLVKRFLGEQDG